MITYPKKIINNRWDSMSETLREVLSSPAYGETVLNIAEDYHLDEHKTKILLNIVGLIIYGLVHIEELDKKLVRETNIKKEMAQEIEEEINRKIFSQFRDQILKIYSPVSEESLKKKEDIPNLQEKIKESSLKNKEETKQIPISSSPKSQFKKSVQGTEEKNDESADRNKPKEDIRQKTTPKETTKESSESKPFMIHQESGFDQKESEGNQSKGKRKRKKSFSFSKDGFFDSNKNKKGKSSPKAEIGTPGKSKEEKKEGGIFGFGGKKKEKERVVHYSDNRTDLSDDGSNKFINLSNLEPTSPKNKKRKQQKSNINKQQKKKKETDNKQTKKSGSSKGNSFLGNIDEGSVNKKDYKKEDKNNNKKNENKGDGPHVDGNTVDLSQN